MPIQVVLSNLVVRNLADSREEISLPVKLWIPLCRETDGPCCLHKGKEKEEAAPINDVVAIDTFTQAQVLFFSRFGKRKKRNIYFKEEEEADDKRHKVLCRVALRLSRTWWMLLQNTTGQVDTGKQSRPKRCRHRLDPISHMTGEEEKKTRRPLWKLNRAHDAVHHSSASNVAFFLADRTDPRAVA